MRERDRECLNKCHYYEARQKYHNLSHKKSPLCWKKSNYLSQLRNYIIFLSAKLQKAPGDLEMLILMIYSDLAVTDLKGTG